MNSRTRILITTAFVCHLLVAPGIVTSQLLSSAKPSPALPNAPSALNEEDVTIKALSQEKQGAVYKLHGQAEIRYGTYILYADEVTYNSDTGWATADGHVVLDGSLNDEHIQATHGTYNIWSETGKFENVVATIGAKPRAGRLLLTSANPFFIVAKVVEKTSPTHYKVDYGTITTCELPHPEWQFKARAIVVEVGGNAEDLPQQFRDSRDSGAVFSFCDASGGEVPAANGISDSKLRDLEYQGRGAGGVAFLGNQSQHGRPHWR